MNEFTRYRATSLSPNRKLNKMMEQQSINRLKKSCEQIAQNRGDLFETEMKLNPMNVDINMMDQYFGANKAGNDVVLRNSGGKKSSSGGLKRGKAGIFSFLFSCCRISPRHNIFAVQR